MNANVTEKRVPLNPEKKVGEGESQRIYRTGQRIAVAWEIVIIVAIAIVIAIYVRVWPDLF